MSVKGHGKLIWLTARFLIFWPVVFMIDFVSILSLLETSVSDTAWTSADMGEAVGFTAIVLIPALIFSVILPLLLVRLTSSRLQRFVAFLQFAPYLLVLFYSWILVVSLGFSAASLTETFFFPLVFIVFAVGVHAFDFRPAQLRGQDVGKGG
jgi:hypothetical protein